MDQNNQDVANIVFPLQLDEANEALWWGTSIPCQDQGRVAPAIHMYWCINMDSSS